ncbi:hypothetical protein EJ05DRAFT_489032 [Pseudovirgaria hyperparasitica]|uniref:Uncharacterized protein n=1 Tax=Pseudovirgaria hyperparasitica TaxID=470096 RepID=A0A6A6VZZ9_9PEZI|nr:uncharacterized protein EJ05DRAFT_489032 [Pseudovirgaria hyperparasitica]KAF2754897.1 hypothetical protein EJ05DRAFT_489032 [Pseudovirgaria hyperparasitica]
MDPSSPQHSEGGSTPLMSSTAPKSDERSTSTSKVTPDRSDDESCDSRPSITIESVSEAHPQRIVDIIQKICLNWDFTVADLGTMFSKDDVFVNQHGIAFSSIHEWPGTLFHSLLSLSKLTTNLPEIARIVVLQHTKDRKGKNSHKNQCGVKRGDIDAACDTIAREPKLLDEITQKSKTELDEIFLPRPQKRKSRWDDELSDNDGLQPYHESIRRTRTRRGPNASEGNQHRSLHGSDVNDGNSENGLSIRDADDSTTSDHLHNGAMIHGDADTQPGETMLQNGNVHAPPYDQLLMNQSDEHTIDSNRQESSEASRENSSTSPPSNDRASSSIDHDPQSSETANKNQLVPTSSHNLPEYYARFANHDTFHTLEDLARFLPHFSSPYLTLDTAMSFTDLNTKVLMIDYMRSLPKFESPEEQARLGLSKLFLEGRERIAGALEDEGNDNSMAGDETGDEELAEG